MALQIGFDAAAPIDCLGRIAKSLWTILPDSRIVAHLPDVHGRGICAAYAFYLSACCIRLSKLRGLACGEPQYCVGRIPMPAHVKLFHATLFIGGCLI